ncbi:MAG TPA: hypothetical protein VNL77_12490 [Roseiflexaceae bacterium]|nr:hypothetical protein [Roseiflexaceae bacterium]
MALLLKDCGLEGFKGSVRRCAECGRATAHFHRPGGWPVCGVCGGVSLPARELPPIGAPFLPRSEVIALLPLVARGT